MAKSQRFLSLVPRLLPMLKSGERAWTIWSRALWRTMCGFMCGFGNRIIAHAVRTQIVQALSPLFGMGRNLGTRLKVSHTQNIIALRYLYTKAYFLFFFGETWVCFTEAPTPASRSCRATVPRRPANTGSFSLRMSTETGFFSSR